MRNYAVIVCILLFGAGMRFVALGTDARLHPDEALFATFARDAAVHGDWMLPGALDKTPLSIYAAALSLHFNAVYVIPAQNILDAGAIPGEFAARWPNVLAGIVLIALAFSLARTLYAGQPGANLAALMCALICALSPYLIVFSASAFTDTLMLLFMVAALLAAGKGRPGMAGFALALSIAAKQQGIFYAPLIAALLWRRDGLNPRPRSARVWSRFGLAFALGCAGLLLWDSVRPETSIFALAAANNDPERFFSAPHEWMPRLRIWLDHAGWLLGAPLVTLALVLAALYGLLRDADGASRILGAYVVLYLLAHWLLAFNTYDRYLLPLIPLLAVLAARGLVSLNARIGSARLWRFAAVAYLVAALTGGFFAANRNAHIGTDGRADDGDIIALADWLNAKPLGAIIYDYWLGWELDYYLGAWTDKRRVYYPEPAILAADALLNPDPAPRYFVAPAGEPVDEWLSALDDAGFAIAPARQDTGYAIYELIPPVDRLPAASAESGV